MKYLQPKTIAVILLALGLTGSSVGGFILNGRIAEAQMNLENLQLLQEKERESLSRAEANKQLLQYINDNYPSVDTEETLLGFLAHAIRSAESSTFLLTDIQVDFASMYSNSKLALINIKFIGMGDSVSSTLFMESNDSVDFAEVTGLDMVYNEEKQTSDIAVTYQIAALYTPIIKALTSPSELIDMAALYKNFSGKFVSWETIRSQIDDLEDMGLIERSNATPNVPEQYIKQGASAGIDGPVFGNDDVFGGGINIDFGGFEDEPSVDSILPSGGLADNGSPSTPAPRPSTNVPYALTGMVKPLKTSIDVVGGFSANSQGVKLKVNANTDVFSILGGEVIYAGTMPEYGNSVMVKHPNGAVSLYAGLERVFVTTGMTVSVGDLVGATGSGNLHFGISINDKFIDPAPYLK